MVYKRICICCGNEYEYCPHCGDSKSLPRWMMNYDDEGCHIAFQTVTDYLAGETTKEAANVILSNTKLKNRNHFKTSVAKYVDEILGDKVAENKVDLDKIDNTKVEVKRDEAKDEAKEEVKEVKETKEAKSNDAFRKNENKFHKAFDYKAADKKNN